MGEELLLSHFVDDDEDDEEVDATLTFSLYLLLSDDRKE